MMRLNVSLDPGLQDFSRSHEPSRLVRLLRVGVVAMQVAMSVFMTHDARAQGSAGPYVPTPTAIVAELLKLADVRPGELLVDLGSGDGRIVITAAAQYGASGLGIDIQPSLVDMAVENARKAGVADRVKFIAGDLFLSDLSKADVVTVYLLPSAVPNLVPKLQKDLRPGTRVVSHDYPLLPWVPERVLTFDFEEKVMISGTTRTVLYLYRLPAAYTQ